MRSQGGVEEKTLGNMRSTGGVEEKTLGKERNVKERDRFFSR